MTLPETEGPVWAPEARPPVRSPIGPGLPVALEARRWDWILADLDGTRLGELTRASQRTWDRNLNAPATCKFQIRMDDPQANLVLFEDLLLLVYKDRYLRFVGDVTSAEESHSGQGYGTVVATATDALWRLDHRLLGKDFSGLGGYSDGTALVPLMKAFIARRAVERVQGAVGTNYDAGGDAGIRFYPFQYESSVGFVGPLFFKSTLELLMEMGATLDGYDFTLDPVPPTADSQGTAIGWLKISDALGQERPEAIFEYGSGRYNVLSYQRQIDRAGLANVAYNLPTNWPASVAAPEAGVPAASVVYSFNQDSIDARTRHETLVQDDLGAGSDVMRQQLVDLHISLRKQPRQIITFSPGLDAPKFGEDFDIGDIVTFRARVGRQVRVNALFRVYGVGVALGEEGQEVQTLTVVPST